MEKPAARQLKNQNRKIFLIASADDAKKAQLEGWIKLKFEDATIFTAVDPADCLHKVHNAPPTVLITDFPFTKSKSVQTIESLISDEEYNQLPILVIGGESQKADYMDAVVTGKIQFIERLESENDLYPFLNRAMNFANALNPSNYQIKYLNPGETLIREGEKSDAVYILKKGKLIASKVDGKSELVLGNVFPGEFVGEMGFLNNSVRAATVKALEESEVVSIPFEIFDKVIFKRPSWSKTILETLSKRLGAALKK